MDRINYASLKKTLTKKELQNVLGGSGSCGSKCSGCCSEIINGVEYNGECGIIIIEDYATLCGCIIP